MEVGGDAVVVVVVEKVAGGLARDVGLGCAITMCPSIDRHSTGG